MSNTLVNDTAVGRHRDGTPGLIHVGSFGIRRRAALFSWFRRAKHRLPDSLVTVPSAQPAFRPAV